MLQRKMMSNSEWITNKANIKDKKEEFEVEAALENEDELADLEGVENSN